MKIAVWIAIITLGCIPYANGVSVYDIEQQREQEKDNCIINQLGEHIVAEFTHCQNLNNYHEIEDVLQQAADAAGAQVLLIKTHCFTPAGMTCIAFLQESHIALHTWPELDYVAIDIFTCGKHTDVFKALAVLQQFFSPLHTAIAKIDRGYRHLAT